MLLVNKKLKDKANHAALLKKAPLIIESWSWSRKSGSFVEVVGEITNNSGKKLESVTAVATFKTKNGQIVTTDYSLLEYNPILAGQKSTFKILTRWNPEMESCNLSFKFLFGGRISAVSRHPK